VTENRCDFGTIFPNPTLALLTSGLFHRGRRNPCKPPSVTVRKKPCPHDLLRTDSSEAHTQPENQALPCPRSWHPAYAGTVASTTLGRTNHAASKPVRSSVRARLAIRCKLVI